MIKLKQLLLFIFYLFCVKSLIADKGIWYIVKKGETLWTISREFNVSMDSLVAINKIKNNLIKTGQKLFIPIKKNNRFSFPVKGKIVSYFGKCGGTKNIGIEIQAYDKHILSSSSGKVVKIGEMRGYGKYVIIEHFSGFVTIYANLSKILVRYGQYISKRMLIGLLKNSGDRLHFELHNKGEPQNPLNYLN